MATSEQNKQQFGIQRIYIKDLSFESPMAPQVFLSEWKPEINVELHTVHNKLQDDVYDVELGVSVTAKMDGKVVFLIEVKQAGIFLVKGFDEKHLNYILGINCPSTLFPYAREAISDVISRGTFPQLILEPINFEALYLESIKKGKGDEEKTH